jgi:hypothetical protein
VANRKRQTAAVDETVDNRPHLPGIYRSVLPAVCLREIRRSPRFAYHGLRDLHDPQAAVEEAEMMVLAEELAERRLAAGESIKAMWYDLPKGLPAPLDKLDFDPSPRSMTIYPNDRVDATKYFNGLRTSYYERARHYPNCDHGYFQAAFALAGEWGA